MKYYTGVGSRECPVDILSLIECVAYKLSREGWTLRSGGAEGADNAFEEGDYWEQGRCEIYIPWNGFNQRFQEHDDGYIVASSLSNYSRATEIAETIHPAWDKLSQGAKTLHTRNVYQVLGKDLNTPSKFLMCWAKPTKNGVSGGTNTAYTLARQRGVSCFNLYDKQTENKIRRWTYES